MNQLKNHEVIQRAPMLISAASGIACSAMALPFYAIGALTKPLSNAYGWSRADVQTAILLCIGVGALVAPLIGYLVERFNSRIVAMYGLIGVSISFFIAASANASILVFYLAFICMAVLGGGSSPVSWTRGIACSFKEQRGLALGIVLAGTGVCAILIPQFTTWMLVNFDVQITLFGLGVLPLIIALPLVYIFFKPDHLEPASHDKSMPRKTEEDGLTLKEAFRNYKFWVLILSVGAIYLAQAGIITNLIPAITDWGFSSQEAANFQSTLGISIIVGRIVIGHLVDKLWAPSVAAVVTFLPVIACLLLPTNTDYYTVLFSTIVIGLAAGAELDFLAFFTAKYFGLAHYARIYSLQYATLALCAGIAPFAFATIFDHYQTYNPAFYIGAGLFGLGSLLVLTLGKYPEKFPERIQRSIV